MQASINSPHVVGGDTTLIYAKTYIHHAPRIWLAYIHIDDVLQFIFDLHPGIAVGIAISLIHKERSCRSKSSGHLDVERRFTLRIRGMTIDVDEREMALKVDTAQVVLDILLSRIINLEAYRCGTSLRDLGALATPRSVQRTSLVEFVVAVAISFVLGAALSPGHSDERV